MSGPNCLDSCVRRASCEHAAAATFVTSTLTQRTGPLWRPHYVPGCTQTYCASTVNAASLLQCTLLDYLHFFLWDESLLSFLSIKGLYQCHCIKGRLTPGSRDECRTVPDDRRPLDQAHRHEPLARLQAARKLHPPSPFIITQPESWYTFYHPTEGRRLSRPRWLVIYPDDLLPSEQSPIQVVTGPSVD